LCLRKSRRAPAQVFLIVGGDYSEHACDAGGELCDLSVGCKCSGSLRGQLEEHLKRLMLDNSLLIQQYNGLLAAQVPALVLVLVLLDFAALLLLAFLEPRFSSSSSSSSSCSTTISSCRRRRLVLLIPFLLSAPCILRLTPSSWYDTRRTSHTPTPTTLSTDSLVARHVGSIRGEEADKAVTFLADKAESSDRCRSSHFICAPRRAEPSLLQLLLSPSRQQAAVTAAPKANGSNGANGVQAHADLVVSEPAEE